MLMCIIGICENNSSFIFFSLFFSLVSNRKTASYFFLRNCIKKLLLVIDDESSISYSHIYMLFKTALNRLVHIFFSFRFFAQKLPITTSMRNNSLRNDNECDSLCDNTHTKALLFYVIVPCALRKRGKLKRERKREFIRKPHCVWFGLNCICAISRHHTGTI